MSDTNPYTPPDPLLPAAASERPYDPRYDGLGGWLILVGIGVLASPLMLVRHLVGLINTFFVNGVWRATTTLGSPAYHPLWSPLIIFEVGVAAISVIVVLIMVPMYFSKKKLFPKWYIWLHLVTLVLVVADAFAVRLVRPDLAVLDPDTSKEIARSLASACIWVPYMLFSKRVASTFRR